jgi:hypothetical protein
VSDGETRAPSSGSGSGSGDSGSDGADHSGSGSGGSGDGGSETSGSGGSGDTPDADRPDAVSDPGGDLALPAPSATPDVPEPDSHGSGHGSGDELDTE